MKLGELVHQMIVNYNQLDSNNSEYWNEYFMQNEAYIDAHDRLNEMGDDDVKLATQATETQGN